MTQVEEHICIHGNDEIFPLASTNLTMAIPQLEIFQMFRKLGSIFRNFFPRSHKISLDFYFSNFSWPILLPNLLLC